MQAADEEPTKRVTPPQLSLQHSDPERGSSESIESPSKRRSKPSALSLAFSVARHDGRHAHFDDKHGSSFSLFRNTSGTYARLLEPGKRPEPASLSFGYTGIAESGIEFFRQLMAIRIIERHYSRHARVVPGQLFADKERTQPADWGELTFPSVRRAAKYMRVSASSEPARVGRVMDKFWRVRRPSVIIAITGSAQALSIPARLREMFCKGLVTAARATDAVIVTGGTASGVMQLAGEAMAGPGGHGLPLIGFVPWRKLHGRALLENNPGEAQPRAYLQAKENDNDGASLEPRHTHFVLADGGPGGSWGDEIPLATQVTTSLPRAA